MSEYKNIYSEDGKTLIRGENIPNYQVKDGCEIIGPGAFEEADKLTEITIPESVVEISRNAFYYCKSLKAIHLPNRLAKIGYCAFFDSGLTSIHLPDSLQSVDEEAFGACYSLEKFTGKFASNDGRFLIHHDILISFAPSGKDYIQIPDTVKVIGTRAFSCCHELRSIIIPNSVVTIDRRAFNHCSRLDSIIVPNSLKRVAPDAIFCCPQVRIVESCPKDII